MIKQNWRPNLTRQTLEHILENEQYAYAVDTETTGLDPNVDTIIEIGIIKLEIKDNQFIPVDKMDLFINPGHPLPAKIIQVTGITDNDLQDKLYEFEVFPQILDFLGTEPIFIAYNSLFDIEMVTSMYRRNNMEFKPILELDVLAMARDLIAGKNTKNGKFNLSTIAEALDLVLDDTHFHLAIDDIEVTVQVLNKLIPEYDKIPYWKCGEEETAICSYWHWESPYNHNQNATYVRTSHGTFLINDMSHFCKDKDMGVIESIDIEKTLLKLARRVGLEYKNFDNFCINLPKHLKKLEKEKKKKA